MGGVLITGGAGTLGREIVRQLHAMDSSQRIVVYSRDEGKQSEMMREFPEGGAVGLRYMLGDVRDADRLSFALKDIDTVIHAAAIKMIDWADYNVFETISVNVEGTVTVAKTCARLGVARAMFISTDKAADGPVGAYGQSKLLAETAFIHANNYGGCKFNVCRYGNVINAAKSCFHLWRKQAQEGRPVTVTDERMTRFFWPVGDAGAFVLQRLQQGERGMTYIPKMQGYKLIDIALKFSKDIDIIGLRCPEKIHESLWSKVESLRTYDRGDYYVIHPYTHQWVNKIDEDEGRIVPPGFILTSEDK